MAKMFLLFPNSHSCKFWIEQNCSECLAFDDCRLLTAINGASRRGFMAPFDICILMNRCTDDGEQIYLLPPPCPMKKPRSTYGNDIFDQAGISIQSKDQSSGRNDRSK